MQNNPARPGKTSAPRSSGTTASAATNNPGFDPLMSLAESAAYLGVATKTLAKMAREREIGCVRRNVKPGSPVRFRLSDLNKWVRAHETTPVRRIG